MGPLQGYKVVEFGGIGPAPFCAMMLADMGADVLRLDRMDASDLGIKRETRFATTHRGRRSIAIDLKSPKALEVTARLLTRSDALIEGFRPGVMERLGLGPEPCFALNPKLVYGRMTGWGQDGPLAATAGHDINYLAISGALHCIGRVDGPPTPPLNLVADLGGGALYLAFGIVCALLEVTRSGKGQVVDAAMIDGVTSLLTGFYGLRAAGMWSDRRGDNFVDGAAPWYDSYETADGKYMSVGSIEGRFYDNLLEGLGLADEVLPDPRDRSGWPALRKKLAESFRQKTRDAWSEVFKTRDACVAPVLNLAEAAEHPHIKARDGFISIGGVVQPAPAPRFSRTKPKMPTPPAEPGADTDLALRDWGFSEDEVAQLRQAGVVR